MTEYTCKKCGCLRESKYCKECGRIRVLEWGRLKAKSALHHAVSRGKLIKQNYCTECFALYDNPRLIHGHHNDYSKLLEVIWLCSICHGKRHRRESER